MGGVQLKRTPVHTFGVILGPKPDTNDCFPYKPNFVTPIICIHLEVQVEVCWGKGVDSRVVGMGKGEVTMSTYKIENI